MWALYSMRTRGSMLYLPLCKAHYLLCKVRNTNTHSLGCPETNLEETPGASCGGYLGSLAEVVQVADKRARVR